MSENLQVTGATDENVNAVGRDYNEKLQGMARSLVSALYMLIRSVKMYDPDNAVFEKPLIQFEDTVNQIIRREGKLELVGVKQSFYLNGMLVKVDLAALDNVKVLLDEMRAKDVGGFTLLRPVKVGELKNFLAIFAKDQAEHSGEDGIAGKKLVSMQVTKFSRLQERLQNDRDESDLRIDRKKYALTVYARAIFFVGTYLKSLREGKPVNTGRALRIIQDFVDLSFDQRTHFLGLTSARNEADYLTFHQVNTSLMAIVFGGELGLTKPQLRDLGYIAMFADSGMALLPDTLAAKQGGLSPDEKAEVQRAPLVAVRNILRERSLSRATLLRVVTTLEFKTDFGTAVRDPQGNIQMIVPKGTLGIYAKLIAICATYDALTSKRPFRDAYGPEVALLLMWTEMRHKFDNELLKVFMKVMAIQPVRVLTKRQQAQGLTLSGL